MEVFWASGVSSGQQQRIHIKCVSEKIEDQKLSEQTGRPSGLRAYARGRWVWRMTMDGGGR